MARNKKPLWEQPANFWIGAGLVAEAPIVLFQALAPDGACKALLNGIADCPPPLGLMAAICLVLFVVTVGLAYMLGLGASEEKEHGDGASAQNRTKLLAVFIILFILGSVVWLIRMRIVI